MEGRVSQQAGEVLMPLDIPGFNGSNAFVN